MPPKEVVLHRPITRKSKAINQETPSDVAPTPLLDVRSDFPSKMSASIHSPRTSSSRSPRLGEDTIRTSCETPIPTFENSTVSNKKRGRGASKGKSIEKAIADNDGKLLYIEFPEGFKKPVRFAKHLTNGIGIVVRHSPELDFVSHWSEIPEHHKLPVYAGLDVWFEVKGWSSDKLVQTYMAEMFQRSYTHWKGRLSASYKDIVASGADPRARSPFDWIPLEKWRASCDHFESEKFKKKSQNNAENNRSHLPFTHTSGSKSYHTRLLEMENQSHVDFFAVTHKSNGVFVNEKAEAVHIEIERLRNQAKDSVESPVAEREIVKQTLGKRSGYERGLGYGVVPAKSSKRSAHESSQLDAFKEKLSNTEEELRDATSCIKSQEEMIECQQELIRHYDERCRRQDDEIAGLREGQNELKEMMLTMMQQNSAAQKFDFGSK